MVTIEFVAEADVLDKADYKAIHGDKAKFKDGTGVVGLQWGDATPGIVVDGKYVRFQRYDSEGQNVGVTHEVKLQHNWKTRTEAVAGLKAILEMLGEICDFEIEFFEFGDTKPS